MIYIYIGTHWVFNKYPNQVNHMLRDIYEWVFDDPLNFIWSRSQKKTLRHAFFFSLFLK